jgi:transcriptional regulator of arginine metabolism
VRERQQRLKVIKRVIRSHRISSQEQLLNLLEEEGYHVTQATLSRDLKLLKVGKQARGSEGYYYGLPTDEMRRERHESYVEDFIRGYVSIDFSEPLAVIRTLTGHADSVAIAIDNLCAGTVLGTVAGDDTVFVALSSDTTGTQFLNCLRELVPELEE